MILFTKHLDVPLTYRLMIAEELDATYDLENVTCIPNTLDNSVEITLNLLEISNSSSTFNHLSYPVVNEVNGEESISFTIILANENTTIKTHQDTTHQESTPHTEKPFENS